MVEVLIEEMFGSDRNRPIDYERAVVIEARKKRIRPLAGVSGVVCSEKGKRRQRNSENPEKGLDTVGIVRDVAYRKLGTILHLSNCTQSRAQQMRIVVLNASSSRAPAKHKTACLAFPRCVH